jgi:hypothetical protein
MPSLGRRHYRGAGIVSRRPRARLGAIGRADQDRLQHGADRGACAQRQVGAAGAENLGGGRQRQGRGLGTSCQARLLRRQERPGRGSHDLHQAARRRQSRPADGRLCDRPAGAGDAGRDRAQEAAHRLARARGQQRVQLSELFRHDSVRAGSQAGFHQGLSCAGDGAESEAADRGDRGGRPGVLQQRIRRRARHRQDVGAQNRLRQDLSALDHRFQPDCARDPGDQSGPGGGVLLSCAPSTRSASSPR